MKQIKLLTAASLIALTAFGANAQQGSSNIYMTLKIDGILTEDEDVNAGGIAGTIEYERSLGFGAAIGKRFTPNIRADLELAYYSLRADKITAGGFLFPGNDLGIDIVTPMVNAYYDINTGTPYTPYVGAGIGWAFQTNGGEEDAFAYQVSTGVSYKASPTNDVFVGYRYYNVDQLYKSIDLDVSSHMIEFGTNFNF